VKPPARTLLLTPPATLVEPCYVAPPPTRGALENPLELYPDADHEWQARFTLMVEKWNEQTQELGNCNKQIKELRNWVDQQTALETRS